MKLIKIGMIFSALVLAGALAACNTVQGAGEDLQAGGHAISKAASKAKNDA